MKSPLITQEDLAAALPAETRPWIRKRLIAVRAVLQGQSLSAATRRAGVCITSLRNWLAWARQGGCDALRRDGRTKRTWPRTMTGRQIAVIRRRIGAALEGLVPGRLRQQLTATDLALGGQLHEGAESAGVSASTVQEWFRELQHEGIAGFLRNRQSASMNFHADLAQLQARAIAEKNLNIRKRIMALAYVAAGVPIPDAARTTQLTVHTVYVALRGFKRKGLASFRNKPIRPRPCKLSEAQLSELKHILRVRPQMSLSDLRSHILAEFGIHYTPAGLKNMLKKQLGIVHSARGSRRIPPEHSSQTNEQHER